jgi:hypothetical protein
MEGFRIRFLPRLLWVFQEKSVVLSSRRARIVSRVALCLFAALTLAQNALAATNVTGNFSPQTRMGYTTGDQWEPALAADAHGHIYILFPQYGAVPDCAACKAPTMSVLVSSDNGVSWENPRSPAPSFTGQFDPQIMVDPPANCVRLLAARQ